MSQDKIKYPEFDRTIYKVWALPHILMCHWVLNPGLVVNELLLGQRIPKVMLIRKAGDQPFMMRTFVPCPHCHALHQGMLWAKGNALGHWFGYLCPSCDKLIPCLRNWTSLIIMTITYPLWFYPARLFKPRWLRYERERLDRVLSKPIEVPTVKRTYKRTLIAGVCWGVLVWFFMNVIPFLNTYSKHTGSTIDIGPVVYGLPICLVLGLVWGVLMGVFMQFVLHLKGKKSVSLSPK